MSGVSANISSYVPTPVVRHFGADPTPLTAAAAERAPSAVLFADISGFTALTERLASRGPVGAEEISRLLNGYFAEVIDLVSAHGGDVVRVAGDAIFALWQDSGAPHDVGQLTLRAAQCGLALQTALSGQRAAEFSSARMRVGVGAGRALAAHIGGPRWEFVLAGEPIVDACTAEQEAEPGDVVLGPHAAALLREQVVGFGLDRGCVRVDTVPRPLAARRAPAAPCGPEGEAALRGYVPDVVLARLDAGQSEWLAELRRVSIAFLRLTGLDYASPAILHELQGVMQSVQSCLARYEGTLRQLMVDDKGTVCIIAFGLPPWTHEDDAARAVQAALTLETQLGAMGLRVSIGIATGRAFCGPIGNRARREYAVVGDVVNLAAHLMVSADDGLLCDAETVRVASRMAFEPLPPMAVKGKAEPVTVYRAIGAAQARRVLWPMCGRAAERARLAAWLDGVDDRTGGVAVVEGEAGIGKSRLVADVLEQAAARDLTTFVGAADAVEQLTPYYAWRPVFSRLLGLEEVPDPKQRREWLRHRLQRWPDLVSRAPLLNSVLALNLADTELTAGMSGDVRADNTRELLVALLRALTAAAPEPAGLLVVLEDAHWLDSASWGLARAVSQHVPHVLLVVVTRPMDEPLPSEYRQLISMPTTERLVLEPLTPRETIQLVCDRLGVPGLPDLVTTLIYERGQGNPFFSEELTATLREDGFLRIVDGRCELAGTAAELEAIRFPDTVQGVISGRIDRLSPAEQLALKVASVIGRLFAVRIVRAIHPVPTEDRGLADAFGALERHDFVRCDAPEPELAYLFKHVLTQETAYSLLLFAQRQQLHQAIAEWYEQWHADDIGTYSPLLAHHWSRAEVAPRALDYLEKAGVQAVASGVYQEAVRFFGDALTLDARQATPAPAGRLGRWHRWLGEAYFSLGHLTEGREHLERAAALLDVPVPATRPRLARYVLNELLKRALVRAVPRLASPDAVQRAREAARAYERLVQIYYYANDPAQMVAVLLRGLNLAERSGPCSEIARLRAGMCVVAGSGPLRALADGYARGALEAAEVVGDVAARGWVLELIAIYRIGVGHWDDADQALSEAGEIATRLKDRRRWEEATALQSSNAYLRGNFAYAARLADDVYRSARHGGNSQGEGWGLVVRAEAALRLGEIDKAADDSQAAATLLADSAAQAEATIARAVLAKARWQQGKSQEARQAAETVLRVVAHSPALASYALEAYGSIAQVLLSLWEVDPARLSNKHPDVVGPARQACRALWKFARAFPIGQPCAYLCQGLADLLVGRPARACRAWRKSLAAADRLRMPYEQALANYELGRHLPAADPDRAAHVAEASRLFRRLGAAIDLARAGTPQVGDATTD